MKIKHFTLVIFTSLLVANPLGAEEIKEAGLYAEIQTSRGNLVYKLDLDSAKLAQRFILNARDKSLYRQNFRRRIPGAAIFAGNDIFIEKNKQIIYPPQPQDYDNSGLKENFTLAFWGNNSILRTDTLVLSSYTGEGLAIYHAPFAKLYRGEQLLKILGARDFIKEIKFTAIGELAQKFLADSINSESAPTLIRWMGYLEEYYPETFAYIQNLETKNLIVDPSGFIYYINSGSSTLENDLAELNDTVTFTIDISLLDGTRIGGSEEPIIAVFGVDKLPFISEYLLRKLRPSDEIRAIAIINTAEEQLWTITRLELLSIE